MVRCFFLLSHFLVVEGCFFLLSHFLVVEDYQLSQSASHLRVPLTMEYVKILSWSISFCTFIVSLIMFCVRLLADL